MKLNVRLINGAKGREKIYKLADGHGLYLEVHPNGAKYWRVKYINPYNKKENRLALGVYPEVTLAQARDLTMQAKIKLNQGIDPKSDINKKKADNKNDFSFENIANKWHVKNIDWSKTHNLNVINSLKKYIFPYIGKIDIRDLTTRQLLEPLLYVSETLNKHETAQRLQQRVTAIMRFAVQRDIIKTNPALDIAGALIAAKTKHHPALDLIHLPDFLKRLAGYRGQLVTRLAIEVTLLTFLRSSEIRFARWCEIDYKNSVWRIPGRREPVKGVRYSERGMKMKTPHDIPMSKQVAEKIKQLQQINGGSVFIFHGNCNKNCVIAESTINAALKRMGYDTKTEICAHGFRTMARQGLSESGIWSDDAIEMQLSHIERNKVKAAYTHTTKHFEERQLMMQWWANYLDANREQYISPYEYGKLFNPKLKN